MGRFGSLAQQHTGYQRAALREHHHAIVGAVAGEDVGEPGVRGADVGGGGAFVEGVEGGWVKEVDASSGGGGEGAVDEIKGVGVRGEFVAEGGWRRWVSYLAKVRRRRTRKRIGELPVWDEKMEALVPLP